MTYRITFEIFNVRSGVPILKEGYGRGGLSRDEAIAIVSQLNAAFELHGQAHVSLEADEVIQYDFEPVALGIRNRLNALLGR